MPEVIKCEPNSIKELVRAAMFVCLFVVVVVVGFFFFLFFFFFCCCCFFH